MRYTIVLIACLAAFVGGANATLALGEGVADLVGGLLSPQVANTNLQTNSGSANCNGVSDSSYHPVSYVPGTGTSYHFTAPVSYTDCSWVSDPFSVYFSAYDFTNGMTCSVTENSASVSDNIFDNSISWTQDIGGCLRFCNQDGYAETFHSTSNTRGAGNSYGDATIWHSC